MKATAGIKQVGLCFSLDASYANIFSTNQTFNSGATIGDATASTASVFDSNKKLTSSSVTATELSYVHNVTSAIQTQLNSKPTLVGIDRKTGLIAAQALATYTVPASDSSFIISTNILVTTSTTHNFTVTISYTDEANISRTATIPFTTLSGSVITAITNALGLGPYTGLPCHIRCKANTSIILATVGTFTTVVYNFEERIQLNN